MQKNPVKTSLFFLGGLVLLVVVAFTAVHSNRRLAWEWTVATTYLNGIIHPVGQMPTAEPITSTNVADLPGTATPAPTQTQAPTLTATLGATATAAPSPTPIPSAVSLPRPAYEKQDANNCGPATLTMYLRTFGWKGTQFDISDVVKPNSDDRNVNVDELVYFVRNKAGWLNADFRVGGDVTLLKKILASGIPVMIEEGMKLDKSYWPNDDMWAGHYLLLTGYDDSKQSFESVDSFYENEKSVTYETLDKNWRQFNRVYIFMYTPDQEPVLQSILGDDWSMDASRQHALETAEAETQANPKDGYAWFNLGSNLVYFDRYAEAARAYDTARQVGLPQRMLRYQFGPFLAYFHSFRTDDLVAVTEYALKVTKNSEETLLWHGWGLYRQGKTNDAIEEWRAALKNHPGYTDALYALQYVGATP